MRRLAIFLAALAMAGCALTSRVATMDLAGSTWELVSMDGEAVAGDAVPTLAFDEGGAVSGSTGCNTFSGDVAINGSELSFGPLVTTRMACADPAANAREQAFLAAMEAVSGYTVDDEGRSCCRVATSSPSRWPRSAPERLAPHRHARWYDRAQKGAR